jgi:hypothetical protein
MGMKVGNKGIWPDAQGVCQAYPFRIWGLAPLKSPSCNGLGWYLTVFRKILGLLYERAQGLYITKIKIELYHHRYSTPSAPEVPLLGGVDPYSKSKQRMLNASLVMLQQLYST